MSIIEGFLWFLGGIALIIGAILARIRFMRKIV